jgi:hypothetical protein
MMCQGAGSLSSATGGASTSTREGKHTSFFCFRQVLLWIIDADGLSRIMGKELAVLGVMLYGASEAEEEETAAGKSAEDG